MGFRESNIAYYNQSAFDRKQETDKGGQRDVQGRASTVAIGAGLAVVGAGGAVI